jgi:F-type H+-transporting ATPase subunit gamma
VALYVVGRKGVGYYRFRNRPIEASWTGFSERPRFETRAESATRCSRRSSPAPTTRRRHGPDGIQGVDELHIVQHPVQSLMTQTPEARFLAPMEVEERERSRACAGVRVRAGADELLDALLPKYINTRIYAALLDSAASESASRRRAMKSASDNADDLLKRYTREMNSARQAAITQEISEIVGGANALAAAGSDE